MHRDVAAGLRESNGDRLTNAPARSRHQRRRPFEAH
jgi:hypothetical protein